MMKEEHKKIYVGVVFALLLGLSLALLHNRSARQQNISGFTLYGYFNKTDGLNNGADVRLAGMKVGRVISQEFADDYRIKIGMVLDKDYQLPVDSSAQIETDGIMGAKHIEIVPGADDEILAQFGEFGYTQDVLILNDLLEKVLGYMRDKKGENE